MGVTSRARLTGGAVEQVGLCCGRMVTPMLGGTCNGGGANSSGHLWATNSMESGEEWVARRHHGEGKVPARSGLGESCPYLFEAGRPVVEGHPPGSGDRAGLVEDPSPC